MAIVRLIGNPQRDQIQRLTSEISSLRVENQLLRAELAARGVDVDALLGAALPAPPAPASGAAPRAPANARVIDEAPVPNAPRMVTRAAAPAQRPASVGQPLGRVAGAPAPSGVIHNPDGSTVQILPNVTRNGVTARAPAPRAPAPQMIAPPEPVTVELLPAPPAAGAPPSRQPPRTQIVDVGPAPDDADDPAARFRLLEID
jgi:hypothetical protein